MTLALLSAVGVAAAALITWATEAQAPAIAATAVVPPAASSPQLLFVPEIKALPLAAPPEVAVTALSDEQLALALKEKLSDLGAVSIGAAHRGALYNGVRFPEGPLWQVMEPKYSYGTQETVLAVKNAIEEVNRLYPNTPRLSLGHISREHGGWLRPHKSHQSGRDIDLGYYYWGGQRWYVPASESNLDVGRTWALISALLKTTTVDYFFVDKSLHPLLRTEAERVGESVGLVAQVFEGDAQNRPVMRHARGHLTHLHVRFASPVAVQAAARVGGRLGASARRGGALLGALKQRARVQAKQR